MSDAGDARPVARVALVMNPRATAAGGGARDRVVQALTPLGLEWTLLTGATGDAGRLAREAVASGATVVATVGGDGTVSEVAAALAGGPVALMPLPGGNANVFGRAIGWAGRMTDALAQAEDALAADRRTLHLGEVEADGEVRTFAMNCGVGIDAATVAWIEQRPRTKRMLRQAGFALGAALATARARHAAHLTAVIDDGEPVDVATVLAACGSPYTYLRGRPLDLVPGADFERPAVHWTGLRNVHAREVSRVAMAAARGRSIAIDDPALITGDVGPGLRLTAPVPVPVQADGEVLGMHTRVVIRPGPELVVVAPPG